MAVLTADRCSALAGCALVALSLAYLRTDLTYDEAVYLQLARMVTETGLPLRRVYENFSEFRLFENSPPFIIYLASISQTLFPGQDLPARLVHLGAFVLPTYALVWWVPRSRFGPWAGCASLLTLLATGSYVRDTPHVLLNIPLGFLACAGLLAFYEASRPAGHRRVWVTVLALTTSLAVWTKYQAVCFVVAIAVYGAYIFATRRLEGVRALRLPMLITVLSGAAAASALIGFYWIFGGTEGLVETFARNSGRIDPRSMSHGEIARALVTTARECESTLGGAALLVGAFAVATELRHRGLLVLLGSYVAATIAFNVTLFRLPGAGSSYLDSAAPALAMLVGPGIVGLARLAAPPALGPLVAAAVIAIHLVDSPSLGYERPQPNGSRVAAAYIEANSAPAAGVLAETVAIEFYSGRAVRPVSFTHPREVVLRSLDGTSGDDISFVVLDPVIPPKNLDAVRGEWDRLLAAHFELVPAGAPGLNVYRRRLH